MNPPSLEAGKQTRWVQWCDKQILSPSGKIRFLLLPWSTQLSTCGYAEPGLFWDVGGVQKKLWLHFFPWGCCDILDGGDTWVKWAPVLPRPRGALLTWEEFILTARNWGRLWQSILSPGEVNCWNSHLPSGTLRKRGSDSLQGQKKGACILWACKYPLQWWVKNPN